MTAMGDATHTAVVVTPHCSATTAPQSLLPSLASLASVADSVLHVVTTRAAQQHGVCAGDVRTRFSRSWTSCVDVPWLSPLFPCSATGRLHRPPDISCVQGGRAVQTAWQGASLFARESDACRSPNFTSARVQATRVLWLPRYPSCGGAWHGDAAGGEAAHREQTHVSAYAAAAEQPSAVAPAVVDESAALEELNALLSRAVRCLRCYASRVH
jgi:hypothetical protein